jgi:hypothetical protein
MESGMAFWHQDDFDQRISDSQPQLTQQAAETKS